MFIVQPKITLDAVAQTSSVDLFVGSVFIATYKYNDTPNMFTLMNLPNAVQLDKSAVNTNYLAKDGWIRAMLKAGFPAKLGSIIARPPIARPLNIDKNLTFYETFYETITVFDGQMANNAVGLDGKIPKGGDVFHAAYDKASRVTTIDAHPQYDWT